MKAILLSGGKGTRVSHLYPDIPKPMIEIDGRPFISYLVSWLKKNYIDDIVISVGHKKEKIIDYFKGDTVKFCIEENPLGTSGALYNVFKNGFLDDNDEYFYLLNADTFCDVDLIKTFMDYFHLIEFKKLDSLGGIVVRKAEDASNFGSIIFDENNKIKYFKEKANIKNSYISTGICILKKDIEDCLLQEGSLEKQVFPKIENLYAIPITDYAYFIDIGTEESLNKLNKEVDIWKKLMI